MYSNSITIQVSELNSKLTGTLKFRKPKASEVIAMSDEQVKLQDENTEREAKGLKPKEVSTGLVVVVEDIVMKCYLSGQIDEQELSKEAFEENFSDINSIMYIFNKLADIGGLAQEKPE